MFAFELVGTGESLKAVELGSDRIETREETTAKNQA